MKSTDEHKSGKGRSPAARNKKPEMERKEALGLWTVSAVNLGCYSALGGSSTWRCSGVGGNTELPGIRTVLPLKQGWKVHRLVPVMGFVLWTLCRKSHLREIRKHVSVRLNIHSQSSSQKIPFKNKSSTEMNVKNSLELHRVCRRQS